VHTATELSSCDQSHKILDFTADDIALCDGSIVLPTMESTTPEDMTKFSALFILGLKEKHKIPQVAMQHIIEEVTTLNQIKLNSLSSEVYK